MKQGWVKTPQGFTARHPFPSTYVFARLLHSSLWCLPLCTGKCPKVSCLSKLSSSWTFGCRQKTFHGLFLSTSVGISRFLASPGLTWVTWGKRKFRELTALSFLKPQVPKLVWLLLSKFLCFSFTCGPGFLTFLNRLSRGKKKKIHLLQLVRSGKKAWCFLLSLKSEPLTSLASPPSWQ